MPRRAEALSLAQDERMYSHVATARDEILRHVSHDIDAVASQLRGETVDAVANLRAEAEASQALAHREAEAATASAARAIATVDDLRQEISEKQGGLVDVSGRVHVEALREEFRAALVSRDEQLQSLRSAVESQPTPSPPSLAPSAAVSDNTKAVAELKAKVNLMEKRTTDAISRFSVLHQEGPAVQPPSSSAFPALGSNQASLTGVVRRLADRYNAGLSCPLQPPPPVPSVEPSPGVLPALPPFLLLQLTLRWLKEPSRQQ